ncbi:MAG: AI-2E family transporter [Lysobacteraceae bacterium]|nr:MAG: AI-2E family transporter [Xanthomonadaceae bacterium]
MEQIYSWFRQRFSNPQLIILLALIGVGLLVVVGMGQMLAPALAAVVIAYLLEGVVKRLRKFGLERFWCVLMVYTLFIATVLFLVLWLLPILYRQLSQLVAQVPNFIVKAQALMVELPQKYPTLITEAQVEQATAVIGDHVATFGQSILSNTVTSVFGIITIIVYLILVPVLVFFFMKDKWLIMDWIRNYLPKNHDLAAEVWGEVDLQIGNYIRGKTLEILIIGAVTYVTFTWFGLQYAMLLATAVGFSVLIPYIGAAVVTIPVFFVALLQFGWTSEMYGVMIAYGIIQLLDGNALVPLLFSEVVNLHPIAIIVAILVFGGLWGFWGVFFAIPLATLVQSVLHAFKATREKDEETVIETA